MRVACYARVSSEDQQERGTIASQLEFARKYADLHELDVVEWYKDDGMTGTLPLEVRPEGARLLQDAADHRFDLLLVYRLDRLGRAARVILNAVYELEERGVKIKSMTEPFDTGDPSGRFLLTILAGVADLERSTFLERSFHGTNRAARAGKWLGGIVTYGYRVNKDRYLEICEDQLPKLDLTEAGVIRLIYRLIADEGRSCVWVADHLNALGVPPSYAKDGRKILKAKRKVRTAGRWSPSHVRRLVVNPTYKGVHEYGRRSAKKGREIITRSVPAIVSADTWERAQTVLRQNQIDAASKDGRKYLLRGLIRCGTCGCNYVGTHYSGPGRQLKAYYQCVGKAKYHGPLDGKCDSKNIPALWIEDLVWEECLGFIREPGRALEEVAAAGHQRKSQKATLERERALVAKAARDSEVQKDRVLGLYRRGLIKTADVEEQLQKITQETASLEERARDLAARIASEDRQADAVAGVGPLLEKLQDQVAEDPPWEVKRDIVKALVQEIIVHTEPVEGRVLKTARVTVRYAFAQEVNHTGKGSWQRLV